MKLNNATGKLKTALMNWPMGARFSALIAWAMGPRAGEGEVRRKE
ncbi:hypothetical protein ACFQHO_00515 [Actinomadura yumaensis]